MIARREVSARRGRGLGLTLFGLAALALVVVAGIYVWPDVKRYIRIHNM